MNTSESPHLNIQRRCCTDQKETSMADNTAIAARAAAEAAVFLTGRSAADLGWPDRSCVARQLAAAVLGGLGPKQYGNDPVGWCIDTLEPAIERRLVTSCENDDLRAVGWPNTPTVATAVVGWLIDEGILADTA